MCGICIYHEFFVILRSLSPSEGEYWYHAPLFGDQGEHFDFSSVRVLMSKIVAAMKLFELRKCRSCGRLNLCPKTRTISKSVQRYYFFVK